MIIPANQYESIERRVIEITSLYADQIDPSLMAHVNHYIDVGEIEMAFELWCLFLMKSDIHLSCSNKEKIINMSKDLLLDKESVYEESFWLKLSSYPCNP